jgi:hypothetical protein
MRTKEVSLGAAQGSQIRLTDAHDPYKDGYPFVDFTVEIAGPGLSARSVVRSYEDEQGLGTWFRQLAEDWRGWPAVRSWDSIEHEMTIDATCDSHGHVRLAVAVRQHPSSPDAWTAQGVFWLEAGEEMSRVARDIADFLKVD